MSLEDKIDNLIEAINTLNVNLKDLINSKCTNSRIGDIIPLSKWNDVYEWPTVSSLRNIIFNAKYNGADSFLLRIGRKIYLDPIKFNEWVRKNNISDIRK